MPLEILDVDAGFDWTGALETIGLPHYTNNCVIDSTPKTRCFRVGKYRLPDIDEENEYVDVALLVVWEQGDFGPEGPTQAEIEKAWIDLYN